jgi:hypothetical protein
MYRNEQLNRNSIEKGVASKKSCEKALKKRLEKLNIFLFKHE